MKRESNKLISLLSTLSKKQQRGCRRLIQSPFFSGNDALLALFDELIKRLSNEKPLKKEVIWHSFLGSKKPFDDARFRKYTSDLFKLVREFLVQESLDEEPQLRQYLYLAALKNHQPDKLIRGIDRNWDEITKSQDEYEHGTFLYQHLLERKKYSLMNYEHKPYETSNVEEVSYTLDIYFIVMKLRNAVHFKSRMQTEQSAYELKLVSEIITFLEGDNKYLEIPVVALHYYMYKMLIPVKTHDAYYNYKSILLKSTETLGSRRAYELFQPALNYSRRRINEDKSDFLTEYLELYKFGLTRDLVFDDGVLDPLQFRNTILTALRLGEYQWAESYIAHHQEKIPVEQRSNAVNYNLATLYFYQKKYDQALKYLRDVEYENTTYNLNGKTMLLAIYYETEADTALDSLFDSIMAYLNRHKEIPDINQTAYRNLVSFVRRLTRTLPDEKKAIQQLKEDIEKQQYIASRPWLEQKIKELKSR